MKSQYIQLLQKQIDKLTHEDFDLEAWKTSTIAVLHRVFGIGDPRSTQIEQLKIDYSSWMLRDSNSNYKPIETAKRKGKELLDTAIEEIEIFGTSESNSSNAQSAALKDLQEIPPEDRKKHLNAMKKAELVELLMKLTN